MPGSKLILGDCHLTLGGSRYIYIYSKGKLWDSHGTSSHLPEVQRRSQPPPCRALHAFKGGTQGFAQVLMMEMVDSREILGTPKNGTPIPILLPYHFHKNPLKYGNGMGPAYRKGVVIIRGPWKNSLLMGFTGFL